MVEFAKGHKHVPKTPREVLGFIMGYQLSFIVKVLLFHPAFPATILCMSKQWKLKPKVPDELCQEFSEYSTLAVQLLYNRGLVTRPAVLEFADVQYEKLHDPFLFRDMRKAVDRIWQALESGEKICIYGDYDADAVTANAVLQQTFRHLGAQADSYVPDRFTEGYGVNLEAMQKIKDDGCTVIITVDCGTNSRDAADWCRDNGIDFIVTDHHEIIGDVPNAFALINPKNPDDAYPYHEITGVGVAFKLACAILQHPKSKILHPESVEGYEKWLLDLVAIGTVADCHSLLGENRILVKYGLKVLQKTKWSGLKALCAAAGLDFSQKAPDTYALGFVIAPRLNAAGRLEHANIALHLLMEEDPVAAEEKAQALNLINQRRQDMTMRVVSEAREQAEYYKDRKVLVLMGEDWPKGIVGLVAGRLAEEYHKPVIVMEKGKEESTGSARTVGEFSVVEALKAGGEFLTRFGGHQQAAGLTLKTEHYEAFYQKVLEYADQNLSEEDLLPQLPLEAEIFARDLNLETLAMLSLFEPFGVGNPHPKFLLKNVLLEALRTVGAASQHVQFGFRADDHTISGIGFNMAYVEKFAKVGDTVDIACELIEDNWNGRKGVKLRVVDIRKT